MNEASGMPTPRTDALRHGSTFTYPHRARELCYELERELAAMELRAMDCVALNERQAINFAKCQSELQQARTMHAEAIEEWAKWEGAAKQARGEAQWIPVSERLPKESVLCALINFDRTQSNQYSTPVAQCGYLSTLSSSQPYWSIYGERATSIEAFTHWMPLPAAPKSPASGEPINAAEKVVREPAVKATESEGSSMENPRSLTGDAYTALGSATPSPAAPNTAPQMSAPTTLPVTPAVEAGQPAAAVPDDPMMVLLSLTPKSDTGILRFPEWHDALRALAAHYEAKGMRMAAEICKSVSAAESERTIGRPTSGEYQIGAEFCAAAILAAATKQEADR